MMRRRKLSPHEHTGRMLGEYRAPHLQAQPLSKTLANMNTRPHPPPLIPPPNSAYLTRIPARQPLPRAPPPPPPCLRAPLHSGNYSFGRWRSENKVQHMHLQIRKFQEVVISEQNVEGFPEIADFFRAMIAREEIKSYPLLQVHKLRPTFGDIAAASCCCFLVLRGFRIGAVCWLTRLGSLRFDFGAVKQSMLRRLGKERLPFAHLNREVLFSLIFWLEGRKMKHVLLGLRFCRRGVLTLSSRADTRKKNKTATNRPRQWASSTRTSGRAPRAPPLFLSPTSAAGAPSRSGRLLLSSSTGSGGKCWKRWELKKYCR